MKGSPETLMLINFSKWVDIIEQIGLEARGRNEPVLGEKISETNEKRIQPKKKKETKEEKTIGADRKWFFTIETCNSTLGARGGGRKLN